MCAVDTKHYFAHFKLDNILLLSKEKTFDWSLYGNFWLKYFEVENKIEYLKVEKLNKVCKSVPKKSSNCYLNSAYLCHDYNPIYIRSASTRIRPKFILWQ